MKLWLLRHARVQLPPGVCYGVSDVRADPLATEAAAQAFAHYPVIGCPVWASPAARAQQMAQALQARRADLRDHRLDARLHEMDFGQWEMQAWANIPRAAVDAWAADFAHHRFGGRESAQQVIDRVAQALDDALALNLPELVWVTHAGVIRALQFLHTVGARREIAAAHEWPPEAPPMGGWMTLDFEVLKG